MKPVTPNGYNGSRRAVVLAGGLSSRFGKDKAPLFLTKIVETLRRCQFEVVISVAKPKNFPGLENFSQLEDLFPLEGPLQALYGTLLQLACPKILLTACDMPFLQPAVLEMLWKKSETADIVLLESKEKVFPLPGFYSRKIIPYARNFLNQGKRDLKCLFKTDLVLQTLPESVWKVYDPKGESIININTEKELEEVKTICTPYSISEI